MQIGIENQHARLANTCATPAAHVPLQAAMRGVPYVIINRGQTEHDHYPQVTLRLQGDVVEIFPSAVEKVLSE